MKFKEYILSVCTGIFIFLSFPRFNFEPLIWVSFVPLFYAIDNKSPKNAFLLGFIAGMTCYYGILYWLVGTMSRYGNLPIFLSIIALILLVAYLSLYIGAFAYLKIYIEEKKKVKSILLVPIIWISLEYLRSFLLSGFPWESLGYSQYLNIPLIQISELTGVYGISFLIVLLNVLMFNVLKGCLKKGEGMLVIFGLLSIFIYGSVRVEEMDNNMKKDKKVKVGILQGNIDQSIKWDKKYRDKIFNVYKDLTIKAIDKKAKLIIWPEASLPSYFQYSKGYISIIKKLAISGNVFILFGAPSYETYDKSVKYYNSAFLIGPDGKVIGKYDKMHLVPFGEYVPFSKILTFVNKMVEGIGDFSSGEEIKNLKIGEMPCGVLICFEGIFPDLVRRFVKRGALFIVNITNDAWFGRTNAPYQLLSMVTFRAIENRVWIVRSANTGISSIIDPIGRVVYNTDIFKRDYFIKDIGIRNEKTYYTQYGDLFAKLNLLIFIIIFIFSLFNYRRRSERENKRTKIENF
jgi:apolipoprotein N-acyltransferase